MSIIFNSADIAETMNNGVSNVTGADSIITENYTNVVQHGIKIDMSVREKTLSGTPPLSFNSNGTPLIDYTIYGNTLQLQNCGEMTNNLWDENYTDISSTIIYKPLYVGNGTFTLSSTSPYFKNVANLFLLSGNVSTGASTIDNGVWATHKVTTQSDNGYITVAYRHYSGTSSPTKYKTMLNSGSTVIPYEPYGYNIPISINGQTNNIYIGSEPLRKAIDSSNVVDTINYGLQQLTRRVSSDGSALVEPVTETIDIPEISTIDGANTIDVMTTLKPSNILITYKGR